MIHAPALAPAVRECDVCRECKLSATARVLRFKIGRQKKDPPGNGSERTKAAKGKLKTFFREDHIIRLILAAASSMSF